MSDFLKVEQQTALDPRDQAYIAQQTDPQLRETMASTILRYRRPAQLEVGDPVPSLALTRLDQPGTVRLNEWIGKQPLLLIFGSYT